MQYATFEQRLAEHVLLTPDSVALQGNAVGLTYAQLQQAIAKLRQDWALQSRHLPIAVAISNHPAWVVLDIAALGCEIPSVPIPFFLRMHKFYMLF